MKKFIARTLIGAAVTATTLGICVDAASALPPRPGSTVTYKSCVMNGKTWTHGSTISITIKTPDGKSTTTKYTCKNGTWVA